jgi:hypothetical protein
MLAVHRYLREPGLDRHAMPVRHQASILDPARRHSMHALHLGSIAGDIGCGDIGWGDIRCGDIGAGGRTA